jgi:hypothetical protein
VMLPVNSYGLSVMVNAKELNENVSPKNKIKDFFIFFSSRKNS